MYVGTSTSSFFASLTIRLYSSGSTFNFKVLEYLLLIKIWPPNFLDIILRLNNDFSNILELNFEIRERKQVRCCCYSTTCPILVLARFFIFSHQQIQFLSVELAENIQIDVPVSITLILVDYMVTVYAW